MVHSCGQNCRTILRDPKSKYSESQICCLETLKLQCETKTIREMNIGFRKTIFAIKN